MISPRAICACTGATRTVARQTLIFFEAMSKQASGSTGGSSHSKRKRDASHERKAPLGKARQEHMEEEFAATYHGLTALYKLLEVQHLQSPLFLPRTLSYRLDPAWQQKEKQEVDEAMDAKEKETLKQLRQRQVVTAPAGATLTAFKIGMTSETMEAFQSKTQRVRVLISLFQAHGKLFGANEFKLLATCLIPVPFTKNVALPAEVLSLGADITVMVFHVVEIREGDEAVTSQSSFTFATPSVATCRRGKELLAMGIDGRKPLFGNLLRLDPSRRRAGLVTVELPAIASSVHGGECFFLQLVGCAAALVQTDATYSFDDVQVSSASFVLCGIVCHIRNRCSVWKAFATRSSGRRTTDSSLTRAFCWQFLSETSQLLLANRVRGYVFPYCVAHDCVGQYIDTTCMTSFALLYVGQVWFHFLYHFMLRRMSEKRSEYSCAWCNMFAGSLRGLVAHLVSSHDRFRFQATVSNCLMVSGIKA